VTLPVRGSVSNAMERTRPYLENRFLTSDWVASKGKFPT
jgi:hypothetical protein